MATLSLLEWLAQGEIYGKGQLSPIQLMPGTEMDPIYVKFFYDMRSLEVVQYDFPPQSTYAYHNKIARAEPICLWRIKK